MRGPVVANVSFRFIAANGASRVLAVARITA